MNNPDNKSIMTVKGYVSGSELGFCHSHEHLFLADGHSAKIHAALRLDDYSKTLDEVVLFKETGGNTIVDAQPVGCGRIAELLVNVSENTGVNIVASTGFHKLIFYPENHWINIMDEVQLAQVFINEFRYGMYINSDTSSPAQHIDAKPGVIKTASDINGVDDKYKKLFLAAAEASVQTGLPVLSHTEMGKGALGQIRLFTDHRIPADSIIVCHLDRTLNDPGYIREVADTGVYLEFDTIGRFKYHTDEEEAEFIVKMVEYGFEDRILIGLDTTRERMKSYGGTLGLDYIMTHFIPLLKSYGLTDSIINKFTVLNPAKAFTMRTR
ncbi:MAG: hypothetical protein N3I35_10995 [Clostridia bacterium]|nr:hypothetical protein [Clostridia bacterium]